MLRYPPFKTETCKYCHAPVVLERQGSGRPLEGRLDYWYTTDHRCPEGERAMKAEGLGIDRSQGSTSPQPCP